MGINSFFKSRNEEWELIPFFKEEWEWDYNPKNQGMDPCLRIILLEHHYDAMIVHPLLCVKFKAAERSLVVVIS